MTPITVTEAWKRAHPGACIGILELAWIDNRDPAAALELQKRETETALRKKYGELTRAQLVALPVMREYVRYYKKFEKTYHVLQQLESVALKGKALPTVSPLVDANFAAELATLVLTAGHDAAKLVPPVCIDASVQGDAMVQMNGSRRELPAGDMVMRDAGGVSCSILYGQDNRSPISTATSAALYVAYAPAGIGDQAVRAQLDAILSNVRLFARSSMLEQLAVLS